MNGEFTLDAAAVFQRLEAEGVKPPSRPWLSKLVNEDLRFIEGQNYFKEKERGVPVLFNEDGYQLVKELRIAGLNSQPKRLRMKRGEDGNK